jgi:hypothetical protein
LDQFMELVSSTTTIGTLVDRSNFAAFVSPVQQCLPLLRRKKKIAQRIVLSYLSGAPSTRLPALDQTPTEGSIRTPDGGSGEVCDVQGSFLHLTNLGASGIST